MSETNATSDNRNDVGSLLLRQAKIIEKRASKNALHKAEWADFIQTLRGLAGLSDRLPPLPPADPKLRPLSPLERLAAEVSRTAPRDPRWHQFYVYTSVGLISDIRRELKARGYSSYGSPLKPKEQAEEQPRLPPPVDPPQFITTTPQ